MNDVERALAVLEAWELVCPGPENLDTPLIEALVIYCQE